LCIVVTDIPYSFQGILGSKTRAAGVCRQRFQNSSSHAFLRVPLHTLIQYCTNKSRKRSLKYQIKYSKAKERMHDSSNKITTDVIEGKQKIVPHNLNGFININSF